MSERITISLAPMQRRKFCKTVKAIRDAQLKTRYQIILLYDQGRDREAFELMEKAATLGCPEAWAHCGEAYSFGTECLIDPEKGLALLERASAAGIVRAKYLLAYLMATGQRAEGDADAAFAASPIWPEASSRSNV